MKIHDTALNKTSTRKTATPSIIFNNGYKFGEELLSEEGPITLEIESLKSFEALFGHRDFSKLCFVLQQDLNLCFWANKQLFRKEC